MSGFGDYLERNYDAGREEEQVQADRMRAQEIEAQIEEEKNRLKSQAINKVVKKKGMSVGRSGKIEEFYNEYVNMQEEYLVDGAILQCNQATWDDFPVPGGNPIVLEGNFNKKKKPRTTLCVNENPISSNGLIFATVGDTIKDINIIPFKCNCKIEADRESEIEKIKNDERCSEHGVCRHLMQLNSEWENVSLEGSSYLSKRDISGSLQIDNYYLQQVRYGIVENPSIAVEKEGLNMLSILFCKHGGIITAVYSGQTNNGEDDLVLIYVKDKSATVSGYSKDNMEAARAGKAIDFKKTTRMDKECSGIGSPDYYLTHHSNSYVDNNGLLRISKIPGVKGRNDFYCVAMAPGFSYRANLFCTPPENNGDVNKGHKLQICLEDNNGKEYSMDVIIAVSKSSEKNDDLYPHDHLVEFVVDNKPKDTVTVGGNVSFDKLLGGKDLEITKVYAYRDGAMIAGHWWPVKYWEDK